MPPAVPVETESEQDSIVSTQTPAQSRNPLMAEENKDEPKESENEMDEEEQDEDGETEVYIVEAILNHLSDFEDGLMRYHVKWKGYEKKADRTWETEENLAGARDILEAYWAKIGGKPIPVPPGSKPSKKRGRQSTGGGNETGTPDAASSAKKQKRPGRKSKAAVEEEENGDGLPVGFTAVGDDDWKPPKATSGSWDDAVQYVDTIEKDDSGELWAYLLWHEKSEDGRFYRSKAKLAVCNKSCPQKMLQFYEKHVVFTNNRAPYTEKADTL